MKYVLHLAFFLAICAANSAYAECAIDKPNYASGGRLVKGCPTDINKLIDKEDLCYHFGGEIGGNENDKQIYKEMEKEGCGSDAFYCHRKKILSKYKNTKDYSTITDALQHIYEGPNEYKESMEAMEKTKCPKY